MKDKRKAAGYLFDEIGSISDKYIAEAQNAPSRRRIRFPALPVAAACALLVIMLALIPNMNRNNNKDNNSYSPDLYTQLSAEQSNESITQSTGSPELFDGTARLIWCITTDTDKFYRSVELTPQQLSDLSSKLGHGSRVSGINEAACLVWISYGNGAVVSPCLSQAAGNTGYGTLFNYSPELEPDSSFVNAVAKIIHNT